MQTKAEIDHLFNSDVVIDIASAGHICNQPIGDGFENSYRLF